MPYPDGLTMRAYDAAQGRDDVPGPEEPPYNAEAARKYLAYMVEVKRKEAELRAAGARLAALGRVGADTS